MLPVIALVGRPNVGKSTLFNAMTSTRDALVADVPGVTRDRQYGFGTLGLHRFIVIDTGGLVESPRGIEEPMARQTQRAIEEADRIVLVVDGRAGVTPSDEFVAGVIRRSGKPATIAVNKSEGREDALAVAEFHALGLGEPRALSAAHRQGVEELLECLLEGVAPPAADEAAPQDAEGGIRVCVVGRPNVGKSTLINRLLGEDRLIAFDEPGTTRDTILVPCERDGRRYTLIDTAGVRRRGRVFEAVEKFSVIKTLQAIEEAHVVVLLLDAQEGVTEQDAHIAAHALEAGRAVVVGINKWDDLDADARKRAKTDYERKLGFLAFADAHTISARDRKGIGPLLASVDRAYAAAMIKLSTPRLTRALQQAVERQQPPRAGLVRPKLRYAHQGGVNPPVVVVHGTALAHVPAAYKRYLERFLADAFKIRGTPLRIQFKSGVNPYARPGRRG